MATTRTLGKFLANKKASSMDAIRKIAARSPRLSKRAPIPDLVMISGYGGAGKDAAADYLVERYGFKRMAFSDSIADELLKRNPKIGEKTAQQWVDELGGFTRPKAEVAGFRDEMIKIGNEMKADNPNALVDASLAKIRENPGNRWVITGPRTPTEMGLAEQIPNSWTVRVSRPNVGPALNARGLPDPTEIALDSHNFNTYIANTGTLEDLHMSMERQMRSRRSPITPDPGVVAAGQRYSSARHGLGRRKKR